MLSSKLLLRNWSSSNGSCNGKGTKWFDFYRYWRHNAVLEDRSLQNNIKKLFSFTRLTFSLHGNKHCKNCHQNSTKFHGWYSWLSQKGSKSYESRWKHWLTTVKHHGFHPKHRFCLLASAVCSFSWEEKGISDHEIDDFVEELNMLNVGEARHESGLPPVTEQNVPDHWEVVLDKPALKIWSVTDPGCEYTQYKVLGRFYDVSAKDFYAVQTDLDYRKQWDKLVLDIRIVDEKQDTAQQVLRWITYFPYPFSPREYVYVRRSKIIEEDNVFAILSRSVEHPQCRPDKQYVRVPMYISDLIFKPHISPDEPGMDFLLTYCDDPRTVLPTALSAWVITSGIPDYVEKLHSASKRLRESRYVIRQSAMRELSSFDVSGTPENFG